MGHYLSGSISSPPWEAMGLSRPPVIGGKPSLLYIVYFSANRLVLEQTYVEAERAPFRYLASNVSYGKPAGSN